MAARISTRCSRFIPLRAGVTWSGEDLVEEFASASISVFADQNGSLDLAWSTEKSNWDRTEVIPVTASTYLEINRDLPARYLRVSFENTSGSDQSELRLQTKYYLSFPEPPPSNYGGLGNLASAENVLPGGTSTELDVSDWSAAQIFVEDTAVASVDGIDMQVSLDDGATWLKYSEILPTASGGVRSGIYMSLDLRGVRLIRFVNASSTDTYTASTWSIVGA